MNLQEAREAVDHIWPGEGVTLRTKGNIHEVVAKDGNVLGRAFGWQPALQQAAKPKLDAAALDEVKKREADREDFTLFLEFLREHLAEKFIAWKAARAPKPLDQTAEAGRAQPDQGKLVHLVRP
jgi:hypothetical protein